MKGQGCRLETAELRRHFAPVLLENLLLLLGGLSLSSRLKDLLGPVTRVKKKKKKCSRLSAHLVQVGRTVLLEHTAHRGTSRIRNQPPLGSAPTSRARAARGSPSPAGRERASEKQRESEREDVKDGVELV